MVREGGEEVGGIVEVEIEMGIVGVVLDVSDEGGSIAEKRCGVEEVEIVVVDFLSPGIVCSIPSKSK